MQLQELQYKQFKNKRLCSKVFVLPGNTFCASMCILFQFFEFFFEENNTLLVLHQLKAQ